jgi:hypothetical protein
MRKVQLGIFFFVILGGSKICSAQQLLSKGDIYNNWVRSHPVSADCDSSIDLLSPDPRIEAQIRKTVQSLQSRGIDTLLVLVNSHPGSFIADTCKASDYPGEVYIFWRFGGKESLKRNPNKCGLDGVETIISPVFGFFSQHERQLEQEYIMPVILSASRQDNKITYNQIISSDIDEYVLYYSVHGHCKRFAFSQADITNKSSLFYSDNIRSQAYQWFAALKKECRKVEKK